MWGEWRSYTYSEYDSTLVGSISVGFESQIVDTLFQQVKLLMCFQAKGFLRLKKGHWIVLSYLKIFPYNLLSS